MSNYISSVKLLAVPFLLAVFGCSGPSDGRIAVEGTVTLDGEPLAGAQVKLVPTNGSTEKMALGVTDQRGNFEMHPLGTLEPGVQPGTYNVTFTTAIPGPNDVETDPIPPERIPAKYLQDGIEFEVPASGSVDTTFELSSN